MREKTKKKSQKWDRAPEKVKTNLQKFSCNEKEVKLYLTGFETNFCIIHIDKYWTTFLSFVKKFYVSKLLDEFGLYCTQSDTYKLVNKLKEEVINNNITFSRTYDL